MASSLQPAGQRRFDVCVRGAGVVGQTLALLLAGERLKVALVSAPRAANADTDVRAYALNAAARDLLLSLRAWPDSGESSSDTPFVTPVSRMEVRGDDGGELTFDAQARGAPALTWIVDVPALEKRLSDAVGFQGSIERLTEPVSAALTVVCEGKRSATRDEFGLEFDVRPYPHHAIAARFSTEKPHDGVARQWFVRGEVLALLPLGGADGNSVAMVWSVSDQHSKEWLAGDPQALEQVVQERCGGALGAMRLQGVAQAWPLEQSRARHWIAQSPSGGVVLAGDAAHAMHPLAGQGLNVGLADVAELARVIREREFWRELGDLKLLRRYERARQADVAAMGFVTDGLFGLFGQSDSRVQALRNWGMSGLNRLGPLKQWLARKAMGQAA